MNLNNSMKNCSVNNLVNIVDGEAHVVKYTNILKTGTIEIIYSILR